MFAQVKALFIPGFYLSAAGSACFLAATLAYVAELFPTEIRATLSSLVLAAQVAAGSLGLVIVGAAAGRVSPSLLLLVGGVGLAGSVLLLRGLPETRGRDLIGHARPSAPLPAVVHPAAAAA
jgi:MFS family permease